jgi:hypothetical protein
MPPPKGKPPHPGRLMAIIRRLAAEGSYQFSEHAFDERMVERGFDADDVLKIMALGEIDGPIIAGKKEGEWRCRVVGKLPWSSREAGVVTVVLREARLIFVTTKWIDP